VGQLPPAGTAAGTRAKQRLLGGIGRGSSLRLPEGSRITNRGRITRAHTWIRRAGRCLSRRVRCRPGTVLHQVAGNYFFFPSNSAYFFESRAKSTPKRTREKKKPGKACATRNRSPAKPHAPEGLCGEAKPRNRRKKEKKSRPVTRPRSAMDWGGPPFSASPMPGIA